MPRGDRTGPLGMGPMTGRAMGYCAGNTGPRFVFGRGVGFGGGFGRQFSFGRGRGWQRAGFGRFWGYPYPPMMSYGHPHGMPYGYPFPTNYGYPYGMGFAGEYPTPGPIKGNRQKR